MLDALNLALANLSFFFFFIILSFCNIKNMFEMFQQIRSDAKQGYVMMKVGNTYVHNACIINGVSFDSIVNKRMPTFLL